MNASHGITAGATMAPTLAPALNSAVARARSLLGYQSATALMAEGKLPPSPRPSAARAPMNPETLFTAACAIAARLHAKMHSSYPIFAPKRSMRRPKRRRPTATPPRVGGLERSVDLAELLVRPPSSASRRGLSKERIWRSM
jgi:hypothetical protein